MKRIYLTIVVLSSLLTATFSQAKETEKMYEQVMSQVLELLDSAKTADDLINCNSQFERIAGMYPDKWLPVYYMAYTNIQACYYDQKSSKRSKWLDSAKDKIEIMKADKNADKSEVLTLYGYYLNALILENPQDNGQKYSMEVIASYEKAMDLDPENPRPVVLLAMFEQFLPDFMKTKRNPNEELEKARILFEKEAPSIKAPYWGEFYIGYVKQISGK
jgi:hypothetical protein